jgi:phage repressor protein C with HTH and peptisase S24 domain
MPALPLTHEQLSDAARLKNLFATWQRGRREAGLPSSQEALSDLLGFNQSAMSQYLNGRIPLNVDAATKFANLIGCAVVDFSPSLASQIERYAAAAEALNETRLPYSAAQVSLDPEEDVIPIKTVNIRVEAGFPGFEADRDFEDGGVIHIPRKVVEANDWVPQCLLATKVRGDSMAPVFADGDIIVVNIADTKPVSGEIYAINYEGTPVVKQMANEGPMWYMRSFNPNYKPVLFRTPDSNIIAKVVYQPGRVVAGRIV